MGPLAHFGPFEPAQVNEQWGNPCGALCKHLLPSGIHGLIRDSKHAADVAAYSTGVPPWLAISVPK
jgi:hypothetical protein